MLPALVRLETEGLEYSSIVFVRVSDRMDRRSLLDEPFFFFMFLRNEGEELFACSLLGCGLFFAAVFLAPAFLAPCP